MLLKNFLQMKSHLGETTNKIHYSFHPFLIGKYQNIPILNLKKSLQLLTLAKNIINFLQTKNEPLLIVGNNKVTKKLLTNSLLLTNVPLISERWLGGFLTNWKTIQTQIKQSSLKNINLQNNKQIKFLTKHFSRVQNLNKLPKCVIFFNVLENLTALQECKQLGIFTIGCIDTNTNPHLVNLPIPINLMSSNSINFILTTLFSK